MELFKSRDQRKRRWAVDLASELGTPEAAALLVRALQDQSWSLREYAIERSARLGVSMVAPLCRLLNSGIWFSRAAAVQALKAIGDPAALGPLCVVAADPNRSVAQSAKEAAWNVLLAMDADGLLERAAGLDHQQRRALAALLGERDADLERAITSLDQRLESEREECDPEAMQKLRAALKAAAKQEARYEDEEP